MKYAKQLMTVSELVEMGFSRHELNQIIHDDEAPVIWSSGRGKARIITDEFDEYLKKRSQRQVVKSSAKVPWSERKRYLLQQVSQKN